MFQVDFHCLGGRWSCGDRSIERHGEEFSAGATQIKRRGRGTLGPSGRTFGLERLGADPRALVSRISAPETLCLSTRKLCKVTSTDKLHLVVAYTEIERKLFHASRDYVRLGELVCSLGAQGFVPKGLLTHGVRSGDRTSGNPNVSQITGRKVPYAAEII